MRRHVLLLSMSLLVPHLASAQEDPESVQRARELFGEGVDQHEHRRYREAVDTFRAVLAIRAAPAVRYNLALNLFELGQYPEADAQVQLILADSATPPPLRDSAIELRTHMDERGGQLQISAEEAPEGAEVQVDGYVVDDSRPVRVMQGTHRVTLVQNEEEVGSEVVSVNAGTNESVAISPSSAGGDGGGGAVVFDGESFEGAEPVSGDWRFWTALGVVAVVVIGIVIGTILDDDDSGAAGVPLLSWD